MQGLSLQWLALLPSTGSGRKGLVSRHHMEFSQIRNWTCDPCIDRGSLIYWSTREVPRVLFLNEHSCLLMRFVYFWAWYSFFNLGIRLNTTTVISCSAFLLACSLYHFQWEYAEIVYQIFFLCSPWRIFIPWSGVEPLPPAVEAWSLNHWTTKVVPCLTDLWDRIYFQIWVGLPKKLPE